MQMWHARNPRHAPPNMSNLDHLPSINWSWHNLSTTQTQWKILQMIVSKGFQFMAYHDPKQHTLKEELQTTSNSSDCPLCLMQVQAPFCFSHRHGAVAPGYGQPGGLFPAANLPAASWLALGSNQNRYPERSNGMDIRLILLGFIRLKKIRGISLVVSKG